MIVCIESGIPGFDELTRSNGGKGGIPENTATLVYGPAKTGKSIFANQFTYHGLLNGEPCLYITTDHGLKQFKTNMNEFQWPIEKYLEDKSLYIIDTISDVSKVKHLNQKHLSPLISTTQPILWLRLVQAYIISTEIIQDSDR